ncbi:hypothetical protein BC936DRAFT_143045 [Jimgerdemannia flammicorona]|uniref:Uncharacterized protein n=2 Tax=Jimgerdemannia flammicorona TaxID=994334 RepID=A0A433Q8X2_9FUNG|nr:hypothetical protein BC936DRAFT_143045 [Jimgerdemannia flammicorona]RUS26223.1 hypothetical protein BC938DRAFT_471056 [Jimgerdemannia flammicorona]
MTHSRWGNGQMRCLRKTFTKFPSCHVVSAIIFPFPTTDLRHAVLLGITTLVNSIRTEERTHPLVIGVRHVARDVRLCSVRHDQRADARKRMINTGARTLF